MFFFQAGDTDAQLTSAQRALELDPTRASLYYFKGQALVAKSTVDRKTQKIQLPVGCAEALQKYLQLEPAGQFAESARSVLNAAGAIVKIVDRTGKS